MFFMGIVLKAEKEKNEDGVPEQGVHLGKRHRHCSQRFTFFPLQTQHQQRCEGTGSNLLVGTGSNLCLPGTQ